ncbi:hypothetical protein THII_0241 [Thioploca ingrica]|uniref:Phosphatidylglycerol lysyltransferase C-terminal domain-containing protein n=1 Tax=Thioploca ingrica TaxID=40754 RepID=A0A090AAL1_9GAMM|nr:hypothetical protein THII_0241 [Thioploca ingrica]
MEFEQFIDHPSGFLALSPHNQRFTVTNLPGFIAYREQGQHWISFGGVHAPVDARTELLRQFLTQAQQQRRKVLAVQVRQNQVPLFQQFPATINQLGSNFSLSLKNYNLAGTRKMKLRHKIKQAQQAGLHVVEIGAELPKDEATFAQLFEISNHWLAAKRKKELNFMIGEIGTPAETQRRIFVTLNASNQPIGFITYVPAWGERPGYLHDLTRRLPNAPPGAMELCNIRALQRLQAEGVAWLHFGFTPFIVEAPELPDANRIMARLVRWLRQYGRVIYPAASQAAYKLKWGIDSIEPEYIIGFPLSFRAIWDLLVLTRSL